MQAVARMSGSFFFASGVTCLLFWLMQVLIVVEARPATEVAPLASLDFVHVRVDDKRAIKKAVPKPPTRPVEAAPPIDGPLGNTGESSGIGVRGSFEGAGTTERLEALEGIEPVDGEAMPLLRVQPEFPEKALARGIEGRVLVEFDVTEAGTVENARIVAFEPSPVFNEAALRAVRQWRYNPKVVNGRTVRQTGMRIAIPFVRDQSSSGG